MSSSNLDQSNGQRVFPDEPQAPPYVLHRHPIPSDQIESLPLYSEEHYPNAPIRIAELNEIMRENNRPRENDIVALRRYIDGIGATKVVGEDRTFAEACMPNYFFEAIENGQEDVVNLLLEHQLVTANTKFGGTTPLLMAVSKKNVEIARQLLKLGADPNEFSFVVSHGDLRLCTWRVGLTHRSMPVDFGTYPTTAGQLYQYTVPTHQRSAPRSNSLPP